MLFLLSFDQKLQAREQSIDLRLGMGASITSVQDKIKLGKTFISPTVGLFWEGGNLLSLGLESSYVTMQKEDKTITTQEFGATRYKANLSGIPLSLVAALRLSEFRLYAGGGVSFLNSTIDAYGYEAFAHTITPLYTWGVSYKALSFDVLDFEIEIKGGLMPEIFKNYISLGLCSDINLFRLLK
jgi:hypothetical protein